MTYNIKLKPYKKQRSNILRNVVMSFYVIIAIIVFSISIMHSTEINHVQASDVSSGSKVLVEEFVQEDKVIEYDFEKAANEVKSNLIYELALTQELDSNEGQILAKIANYESNFRLRVEPNVFVKYCQLPSGKLYVVELQNVDGRNIQAECPEGHPQVKQERSYGMFQILPSTANRVGCDVNWRDTWQSQTLCAIKIYKRSGFTQWSVYKKYIAKS